MVVGNSSLHPQREREEQPWGGKGEGPRYRSRRLASGGRERGAHRDKTIQGKAKSGGFSRAGLALWTDKSVRSHRRISLVHSSLCKSQLLPRVHLPELILW